MTKTIRIPVNHTVIDWAINYGEKSYEELIQKYKINSWKNPKKKNDSPTLKQLQNFSNDTRIPFYYFLNDEIPKEDNSFVKFRTVNNSNVIPSRKLIDTINNMKSRQAWMKDYINEEKVNNQFKLNSFITFDISINTAAKKVANLLDYKKTYEKRNTDEDTFKIIRQKISSLGIMVMKNGVVGFNNYRKLDVNEFRAFALVDKVAPLIFINKNDSQKAQIFSLVHEFIHILIGQSEILNVSPDLSNLELTKKKERWINSVTINTLLPKEDVLKYINKDNPKESILSISKHFHTSLMATSIYLKELGIYKNIDYIINWAREKQDTAVSIKNNKEQKSVPAFYNTAISRVDARFANDVINSEKSGQTPIGSAASMLGVSVKSYDRFVQKFFNLE